MALEDGLCPSCASVDQPDGSIADASSKESGFAVASEGVDAS